MASNQIVSSKQKMEREKTYESAHDSLRVSAVAIFNWNKEKYVVAYWNRMQCTDLY